MYITVLVQRQSGWFVSNVFVLISLLLFYDWFTFMLPPVRPSRSLAKSCVWCQSNSCMSEGSDMIVLSLF